MKARDGKAAARLTADGLPPEVAEVWARWHKEMTADLFALLLGGPAAVESLMDVVDGRLRNGTFVAVPGTLITKCPSKYAPEQT